MLNHAKKVFANRCYCLQAKLYQDMADVDEPKDRYRQTGRIAERFVANFFQCGEKAFMPSTNPPRRSVFIGPTRTEVDWLNGAEETRKPFDIQIR